MPSTVVVISESTAAARLPFDVAPAHGRDGAGYFDKLLEQASREPTAPAAPSSPAPPDTRQQPPSGDTRASETARQSPAESNSSTVASAQQVAPADAPPAAESAEPGAEHPHAEPYDELPDDAELAAVPMVDNLPAAVDAWVLPAALNAPVQDVAEEPADAGTEPQSAVPATTDEHAVDAGAPRHAPPVHADARSTKRKSADPSVPPTSAVQADVSTTLAIDHAIETADPAEPHNPQPDTATAHNESTAAKTSDTATGGDPLETTAAANAAIPPQRSDESRSNPAASLPDLATGADVESVAPPVRPTTNRSQRGAVERTLHTKPTGGSSDTQATARNPAPSIAHTTGDAVAETAAIATSEPIAEQAALPELDHEAAAKSSTTSQQGRSTDVASGKAGAVSTVEAVDTRLDPHLPAVQEGVDRVRFVQRVAKAFQILGPQDGQIEIRLSPPELGSLHLEVRIRDGRLTARVEAETEATRQLLTEQLPQLRQRLAEQQIQVERFDIEHHAGRNTNDFGQSLDDRPGDGGGNRPSAQRRERETTPRPARLSGESPTADGRLNVLV